jgi:hypothetical protein
LPTFGTITEIDSAVPIIDRISAFQAYRIYQQTLLQYSPNTHVPAQCSGISRCRNSAPKILAGRATHSVKFRWYAPLSTTVRTSVNVVPHLFCALNRVAVSIVRSHCRLYLWAEKISRTDYAGARAPRPWTRLVNSNPFWIII